MIDFHPKLNLIMIRLKHIAFVVIMLCSSITNAQDFIWTNDNGNGDGTWETDQNWDVVAVPDPSSTVIFDGAISNESCTISSDVFAGTIVIRNDYSGTITIATGGNLECGATMTVNASGFSGTFFIETGGAAIISAAFTVNATGNSFAKFIIDGDFTVVGSMTINTGTFNASNATTLQVNGSTCALGSSTFTAPSGTMVISGSLSRGTGGSFTANMGTVSIQQNFATRTISANFTGANAFNNLIIGAVGSSRTITMSSAITVNGSLTLESGGSRALTINNNEINVSGNLDISGHSGTGGDGGTTLIRLVGNTTQHIIGTSLNTNIGITPTIVINQASGGSVTLTDRINIGRDLTINSNGSITFNPGSTIAFQSAVAASLNGTTTLTNLDLQNLIINKTSSTLTINAGLTPNVRISGILTIPDGTLITNGKIIFRSTGVTSTGQLGAVSGTLTGNITVERFIPANSVRRWRFLAAPVTSGPTIRNGWQSQIFITGPGTGSGPVGTANYNSNGFDWTTSNSPSLLTYNETSSLGLNLRWESPATTTGVNLGAGIGYRVFIRGDRSNIAALSGGLTSQAAVTLSVTGSAVTGTYTGTSVTCSNGCTSNDGYNLVGNPYPATLDWNDFQTTNSSIISSTYHVYDPNSNATLSWNGTTGSATRFIASGQAFWVRKTAAGSAALTFQESHKETAQTGAALFKTTEASLTNHLKISLNGTSFSNSTFVHLNNTGQYGLDERDAFKLGYSLQQVSTLLPGDSMRLDINNLPPYGTKVIDTVEIDVNVNPGAFNYVLIFDDATSFDSNVDVYLQDKFLNTTQNLKTNNSYAFATTSSALSVGKRFRLLITSSQTALPVTFTYLEAKQQNKSVSLNWSTITEKNNAHFIIEHSNDLQNFTHIGSVKGAGNSSVKLDYSFAHELPLFNATNYYRVKQVDFNGKFSYSNIASINIGNKEYNTENEAIVKVFPMPVEDGLNITGIAVEEFDYTIQSLYGSIISNGKGNAINGESKIDVSTLNSGVYLLILTNESGLNQKVKFIKQ